MMKNDLSCVLIIRLQEAQPMTTLFVTSKIITFIQGISTIYLCMIIITGIIISYTPRGYLPNPIHNFSHRLLSDHTRKYSLDANLEAACASEGISRNYQFIGRLIGRAIFDGIPLGITLNPLMFVNGMIVIIRVKSILSIPLTEKDILLVNSYLYSGIHNLTKEIQNNPAINSNLDLRFSVDVESSVDGEVRTDEIDLIPNGRNLRVCQYER